MTTTDDKDQIYDKLKVSEAFNIFCHFSLAKKGIFFELGSPSV